MTVLAGHDASYLHVVWIVASGLGIAVAIALYGVYRRASRRRELEEAEAILAADDE